MKTSDTHAFVNQLLVCLLVTFSVGGSIGLGTVWMRHQNALLAKANRALETRIAEINRALSEVRAEVESEQSAEILRRRNTQFHLGLVEPSDRQVTLNRVTLDPERRLAQRHGAGSTIDGLVVRVALRN